jgi:hypothetical protein
MAEFPRRDSAPATSPRSGHAAGPVWPGSHTRCGSVRQFDWPVAVAATIWTDDAA